MAVLREVKYLEQRGVDDIPASAAKIYEKNDTFRDYINNLDLTVKWYNKVRVMTLFLLHSFQALDQMRRVSRDYVKTLVFLDYVLVD